MSGSQSRPLPLLTAVLVVLASLVAACSGGEYAATPIPGPSTAPSSSTGAPAATATTTAATCRTAADYLKSYSPDADADTGLVATIIKRRRLIAGVSADTLLFGARNPKNGQFEGFDIDLLRAIAKDLGVSLQFRVLTTAQRIPALQKPESQGGVDIVARTMSITCDRWTQVAFSAQYYEAGQKVLVGLDSPAQGLGQLAGKKVCAPAGSTSLKFMQTRFPQVVAVPADTHTGCLALFQQGQVDGITGDDTVLAGLVAQDPYAKVVPERGQGEPLTSEPYGLAMPLKATPLVRRVNAVLEKVKSDGEWTSWYDHWLSGPLGPAPTPPRAIYGRG